MTHWIPSQPLFIRSSSSEELPNEQGGFHAFSLSSVNYDRQANKNDEVGKSVGYFHIQTTHGEETRPGMQLAVQKQPKTGQTVKLSDRQGVGENLLDFS